MCDTPHSTALVHAFIAFTTPQSSLLLRTRISASTSRSYYQSSIMHLNTTTVQSFIPIYTYPLHITNFTVSTPSSSQPYSSIPIQHRSHSTYHSRYHSRLLPFRFHFRFHFHPTTYQHKNSCPSCVQMNVGLSHILLLRPFIIFVPALLLITLQHIPRLYRLRLAIRYIPPMMASIATTIVGQLHHIIRAAKLHAMKAKRRFNRNKANFSTSPIQFLVIPIVAALVGYITNLIGVKMLFYPVHWTGIPILRWPDIPWGILGFQGVVPASRFTMAHRIVDDILVKLLSVQEIFAHLNPNKIASDLVPDVKNLVFRGIAPSPLVQHFLKRAIKEVIKDIEALFDIKSFVVKGLTIDAATMGTLIQKVGKFELRFLVNSGLHFGFVLGIIQMLLWMAFPYNWTLPIGGILVGYITNWVALKWIFEPLVPLHIGPFVFQGLFLQRQNDVSEAFSSFIATNVIKSHAVWTHLLATNVGPGAGSKEPLVSLVASQVPLPKYMIRNILDAIRQALQDPVHNVHATTDKALNLQKVLQERLITLSPQEFEGLLHPVFQQHEIALIIAGAVLGGLAGGLQWWVNVYVDRIMMKKKMQMQMENENKKDRNQPNQAS